MPSSRTLGGDDNEFRGSHQVWIQQLRRILGPRGAFGILVVADVVAGIIDAMVGLGFVGLIVSLALLLPGIAVSARRLHDIDRTAWWLLIALTGIGLIVLLVFDCIKGTAGPNRFGPDPLGA